MKLSAKAQKIHSQINKEDTKMGDLRKIAKEVKKDHELALELWSTGDFFPQQLAILIMDKKLITLELVDQIIADMEQHDLKNSNYLSEWFMANQLMKDKKLTVLLESWENATSPIKRRLYWYHEARLRWTGKIPKDNTAELLSAIEERMENEVPQVQWTMNFVAAWIGVYETEYRERCIEFGEKLGLYKEEKVPKNCTPNYLPEFIRIEVAKREK